MFNYDKFFEENPVGIHDQPERHSTVAALCTGHVVDIGCGTGSLCSYYKGEYTGYDVSSVAISKAVEHRRADAHFSVADFVILKDFDFSSFDTIVMAEFLEHIEDDSLIFNSIKETAKPGTVIIISVPNADNVPSPDHVREFTAAELRAKLQPFGKVKFHEWPGSNKRFIVSCIFKHPETPLLTLGIVAKNEGKGIERALLSGLACADRIIVGVDDSTTDDTEKIARKYTDNVFTFKWNDDFSAMRNDLLKRVETEWTFFIDGHEYISVPPSREILKTNFHDAIMCQNKLENGTIVRYPRLHHSNLRYEDKVHNKLVCNNLNVESDVMIIHDRVGGQSDESTKAREIQRNDMILRIMGGQIKDNKKNLRASMHLGLHFHTRKNYKKAIKYYKLYLRYSKYPGERWYIRFNIAMCYSQMNRFYLAGYNARLLEKESPNRWESHHVYGFILFMDKCYKDALQEFVASLDNKKQESEYKPLERNNAVTFNYIGECLFNLKEYQKAGEAFKRASKRCDDGNFKGLLSRRSNLMFEMAIANEK